MKSTATATPVKTLAPQPPAFVSRSVEWLENSQEEVDLLEMSAETILAEALNTFGVNWLLQAIERIEGIKVFHAPDISPEDADPTVALTRQTKVDHEKIAEVYALARQAEAQAKAHRESLLPMVETALIQYSAESGKVSLQTKSATVTLARSFVDSPEVAKAKTKLKKTGEDVLKQSPVYQQELKELEQTKEQYQGEQKTTIRVSFWEEL